MLENVIPPAKMHKVFGPWKTNGPALRRLQEEAFVLRVVARRLGRHRTTTWRWLRLRQRLTLAGGGFVVQFPCLRFYSVESLATAAMTRRRWPLSAFHQQPLS
jgi:hypothetical protein